MAKTKAFTQFIGPNGSDPTEGNLVNQSSPAWVLTFVRWNVRDTLRALKSSGVSSDLLAVRDPLVVENDCIQCTTGSNKSSLTPSMTAMLVETDVNYSTAIAPGDFVFVNMLNWEQDARRIADTARSKTKPINGPNDGFKGIYKVQSVRKTVVIDPEGGTKRVLIRIDGYAFTEFNNSIYYNPYLNRDNQGTDKDALLFSTNIHADYSRLMTDKVNLGVQDIIKFLIQSFVGVGISDQGVVSIAGSPVTANTHFFIPQQVGIFLGSPKAKSAKDVYNYLFGIQNYSTSTNQSLQNGMNPSNIKSIIDRFAYTNQPCGGQCLIKAEYWNCQNTWSILNQYANSPLNELYTCFRISPTGSVMPTVVFRQIPFTTDFFGKTALSPSPTPESAPVTLFSTIPRWKISTALILASDIGRDEAARVNFVQYYVQPSSGSSGGGKTDGFIADQTASLNFVYDINDVTRSGLRPHVITTNFEDLTILNDTKVGRRWAQIVGDALVGGHLKMNGTVECVGIVNPISVGDNLEFDGIVFHIEEIANTCSINPQTGAKMFRTSLKLSNGVSVSTTETGIAYAEMTNTTGYNDRKNDYENVDQILPGVSEEQDVVYRVGHVTPTDREVNKPDSPFIQPGQVVKVNKRDEDNE